MFWRHPLLSITTLLYLGFVALVTLGPEAYGERGARLRDRVLALFAQHELTSWIDLSMLERLANVALFVPVGVLLLLVFGRKLWFLAILLGAAFSVGIEYIQGRYLPTRVSDPMDVAMNTTGTVVGVIIALLLTAITEHYYHKTRKQQELLEQQEAEIQRLRNQLPHT